MKKRIYYDSIYILKLVYEFLIEGYLKLYVLDCYIIWFIYIGKFINN